MYEGGGMKNGLGRKVLYLKNLPFAGAAFILMALIFSMEGCATVKTDRDYITNISFSADGKKILFDRLKDEDPYQIQVYELATGELSAYQPPVGEKWNAARYAYDGSRIVFTITPIVNGEYDLADTQLALMDPDGRNVRKITHSPGLKEKPSFSHFGEKIIFARAETIRKHARTRAADYDVYELDLRTGKETRLTHFNFYQMGGPQYFPDDERFFFSAWIPNLFPGISDNDHDAIAKKRDEYFKRYIDNNIYVMTKVSQILAPFMTYRDYSGGLMMTADGQKIFFRGSGYKPDGSGDFEQIYLYSPSGDHRRLTNLNANKIPSVAVSPDGTVLAIVFAVAPRMERNRIVIYRVEDSTSREISLPDHPALTINNKLQ